MITALLQCSFYNHNIPYYVYIAVKHHISMKEQITVQQNLRFLSYEGRAANQIFLLSTFSCVYAKRFQYNLTFPCQSYFDERFFCT